MRHGLPFPRLVLGGLGVVTTTLTMLAACDVPPPKQQTSVSLEVRRKRPHKEPGASLAETEMCSCVRCEVASCCKELEADDEQAAGKCSSYDFESCGGLAVSSCEGRCFQHRWRADRGVGCSESRPASCCYADL